MDQNYQEPAESAEAPQPQGVQFTPGPEKKNPLLWVIAIIIIVIIVAGGLYYWQSNLRVETPDEIVNEVVSKPPIVPEIIDTADWPIFNSEKFDLTFLYPSGWEVRDKRTFDSSDINISAPETVGDFVWRIFIYDSAEKDVEELIGEIGAQYPKRQISRGDLYVSSIYALRAIVITDESPDWYSDNIIIAKDNKIYHLTNGGVEDKRFDSFATSLQFVGTDYSDWLTYTNIQDSELDVVFEFKYPVETYVDGDDSLRFVKVIEDDKVLIEINAVPETSHQLYLEDNPDGDVMDFALHYAINACAADGVGGSISCLGPTEPTEYSNSSDAYGYTFNLVQLYIGEETEEIGKGPIYAFDVFDQTEGQYRLLFVSPRPESLDYDGIQKMINSLANTIKF